MFVNEVTVIFCTCDAFNDLWGNFFFLFKKYWPEFDGKIILNTETKSFFYEGLNISKPLNCKVNLPWEDRLILALEKVDTSFVLIFLDDYYLKRRVKNHEFVNVVNFIKSHPNIKSITFLTEPGGTGKTNFDGFQKRSHFTVYKVTGHITLWDKEYLNSILRKGETAWDFEINGTIRSWLTSGDFYCKDRKSDPIFSYDWGLLVNRGKFYAPILKYFQDVEGLTFDEKREVIASIPLNNSNNFFKKIKYFTNGIRSIFKNK